VKRAIKKTMGGKKREDRKKIREKSQVSKKKKGKTKGMSSEAERKNCSRENDS